MSKRQRNKRFNGNRIYLSNNKSNYDFIFFGGFGRKTMDFGTLF
jgi:hypothetical protein